MQGFMDFNIVLFIVRPEITDETREVDALDIKPFRDQYRQGISRMNAISLLCLSEWNFLKARSQFAVRDEYRCVGCHPRKNSNKAFRLKCK